MKELFEQKGKYIIRTIYNNTIVYTIRLNTETYNIDYFLNGMKTDSKKFYTLDEAYNFFRR